MQLYARARDVRASVLLSIIITHGAPLPITGIIAWRTNARGLSLPRKRLSKWWRLRACSRSATLTFHLDEVEIVDGPHDGRIVQRQIDDGRDTRRRIGDLLVPGHVRVGDAIDQHRADLDLS